MLFDVHDVGPIHCLAGLEPIRRILLLDLRGLLQRLERRRRLLIGILPQHLQQMQLPPGRQRQFVEAIPRLYDRQVARRQQLAGIVIHRRPRQQMQLRPSRLNHQPSRHARAVQELAQRRAQLRQALIQRAGQRPDRRRTPIPCLRIAIHIAVAQLLFEPSPLLVVDRRLEALRRIRPAFDRQNHTELAFAGQRQAALLRATGQLELHDRRLPVKRHG
jgi:hypothetical protein